MNRRLSVEEHVDDRRVNAGGVDAQRRARRNDDVRRGHQLREVLGVFLRQIPGQFLGLHRRFLDPHVGTGQLAIRLHEQLNSPRTAWGCMRIHR